MPSLFVIHGRDQGRRFELLDRVLGVGRDVANRVRLHDTEVSRRHAEIRQAADGYQWVDLGSSNGSFVNTRASNSKRSVAVIACRWDARSWSTRIPAMCGNRPNKAPSTSWSPRASCSRHASSGRSARKRAVNCWPATANPTVRGWPARSNLQIMYRTALAVSHTLDIDQLLQRIMELIFEWVEADRGCIMLLDRETDEFVPKVRRDRQGGPAGGRMTISRTILDYVRQHQEGVLTSDAHEDQRWDTAASILKLGVREAICVPMQGRYGIVGVIYIDTFTPPGQRLQQPHVNKFSDEHLKLMVAIGHQAALAVEDTSFYGAMLQAERLAAIGQTIAGLSHHVKNILQGIRGGSYLIQEGLKAQDWEVSRKGWDIVDKNQQRISALVMDMLTFSKEREPEMLASDLNRVVGDVLELMTARASEAGVRLIDQRAATIPEMTFDPEGIHRAVLNVVTNAIDACEESSDGQVAVQTDYDPAGLLIVRVRDNGVGLEPGQISRIFQVFVSAKGNRGTGLGLAVSQKILQEHGGEIRVESQPGQGSCFTLQWPALPVESPVSLTQPIDPP